MKREALPLRTLIGGLVFLVSAVVFETMALGKPTLTGLAVPAAIGWVAVLAAAYPLVAPDRRAGLYFAVGILALMIFFIHQTYGYSGRVRNFPLIIGYCGVVLCLLDIVSLTDSRVGGAVLRFFGSHLQTNDGDGERKVAREFYAFAAMGGCVLGIWLFGFLGFSPVFVLLWMLAGGKTFKASVYGGVFSLLFIYLLFELAFQYELYRGVFFVWLLDL